MPWKLSFTKVCALNNQGQKFYFYQWIKGFSNLETDLKQFVWSCDAPGGSTFLGVRFEVEKTISCLKLVRITLENSNLARKYKHICIFRKYTFQYQGLLNFADVSIFCKKSVFFGQNSTFTQSNSVRVVLEIFSSVFSFCKIKSYY